MRYNQLINNNIYQPIGQTDKYAISATSKYSAFLRIIKFIQNAIPSSIITEKDINDAFDFIIDWNKYYIYKTHMKYCVKERTARCIEIEIWKLRELFKSNLTKYGIQNEY